MDRHTESFICFSIFVFLLHHVAHCEECSETFNQAPGRINRLLSATSLWSTCKYHFQAPADSLVVLTITSLSGFSPIGSGGRCVPRLTIKNIGLSGTTHLLTVSNNPDHLPIVVQSLDNRLKVIFRGHTCSRQMSSFAAYYSFHPQIERNNQLKESYPLVRDVRKTSDNYIMLSTPKAEPSQTSPGIRDRNATTESGDNKETYSRVHLFFLAILAPITLVCLLCCIIMYIRQHNNILMPPLHHRSQRHSMSAPSDNTPPMSQQPLMQGRPFSVDHQQEMLRQQRETVCRRSQSTEDYPATVVHYDEEAHPFMQGLRLFDEDPSRIGIRAPPNRTVFDSIEGSLLKKKLPPPPPQPASTKAPSTADAKSGSVHRTDSQRARSQKGKSGLQVLDSETKTPLKLLDPDSEGPPPYIAIVKKQEQQRRPSSEVIHVCDTSPSQLVGAHSEPSVQQSSADSWSLLQPVASLTARPLPSLKQQSDLPRASSGHLPRPSSGQSPRPSSGQSPHRSSRQLPWPSSGQSPRPSSGQSPRPSSGQSPRPSSGQSPRPSSGQSPRPSSGQSPRPSSGQLPRPSSGQSPQPSSGRSSRSQPQQRDDASSQCESSGTNVA